MTRSDLESALVMSFGGGVQSWGYAALAARGDVPMPELAVMIDTGRECASTWAYLDAHHTALPFQLVVARPQVPGIFYRNGDCLIPAYFDGGKLPVFCSGEWKRDPFRRYLRQTLGIQRARVIFGISRDEAQRMTNATPKWQTNVYPLVEQQIRRGDCLKAATDYFGEAPPRSRCWMCPNQNREDWLGLPDGELTEAAVVDADIRRLGLYLSRHRVPLREGLALEAAQLDLFGDDCDGGYCYV
jgi:hypothetical protein